MKYRAPGVYIEEISAGDKPIEGVGTSTALLVGVTQRGPVTIPTLVTSVAEFNRVFGGMLDHRTYTEGRDSLPYAVEGFFNNGGRRLYVLRIIGSGATFAETDIFAEPSVSLPASELPGRARSDDAELKQIPLLRVHARFQGCWGNQLRARVGQTSLPGTYDLIVERMHHEKVVETEVFEDLGVHPSHTRYGPKIVGAFNRDKLLSSESGESQLIRLSDFTSADDGSARADEMTISRASRASSAVFQLIDGMDDLDNIDDFTYISAFSDESLSRIGVQSVQSVQSVSLVAVPGRTSVGVQAALIEHCEQIRYRFAVLESSRDSTIRDAISHRQNFDTTRAAIYHPWLVVPDPFGAPGDMMRIPPSGHMMGIYARTDIERGVWKAPANEVVRGIIELANGITNREQDILNPMGINVFRDLRTSNRGIRIWGARTLSGDPEWKYINVRRFLLFLEQSMVQGLQFAVFEPNTEILWAKVKLLITNFLITYWHNGGLKGIKPEEAFFVNVGYNVTMTQSDIDNRRMIVRVGVAVVKPAEFIIIRIGQQTGEF